MRRNPSILQFLVPGEGREKGNRIDAPIPPSLQDAQFNVDGNVDKARSDRSNLVNLDLLQPFSQCSPFREDLGSPMHHIDNHGRLELCQ